MEVYVDDGVDVVENTGVVAEVVTGMVTRDIIREGMAGLEFGVVAGPRRWVVELVFWRVFL